MFAMGQAIAVRQDFTAAELRRLATRTKDVAQARRLLAIAAILDGAARAEAARIGGMDRQTLRDWVIRFNEQGPEGLINIVSPGSPPKLDEEHRAFLARVVEEGPIPAVHGVVRWRGCDLTCCCMRNSRGGNPPDAPSWHTPVEIWFQDEMRVGQKNKLTYRWARKGSRPRATHDQRTQSARYVRNWERARPSWCRVATARPCNTTST
jgi:transposase